VRAAAIEALGELKAKDGQERVLPLLEDSSLVVRRAAAIAAGKLSAKPATEPLLKLAANQDSALRRASLDSLRLLHEPRVVPLAVSALNDRDCQLAALDCLRELGSPDQAGAVVATAKQSPSGEVPLAAVRALTAWQTKKPELTRAVAEVQGAS